MQHNTVFWILTFSSPTNIESQINIVKSDNPKNLNSITIEVSDIDNIYEEARLSKYEITYPISKEPWGVRWFFIKDPDDITINLMSHILEC
jgi:uncharacterized glyoxalase superfamily protein PhnB